MEIAPEYCVLVDRWFTCMTKSEWSGWMQAFGAVLALVVAIVFPLFQARSAKRAARVGHFEAIAMDVRIGGRQALVYRKSKYKVPAYRLPLYGSTHALPALLADGCLNGDDATALAQFYVDASSFNFLLDATQALKHAGGDWRSELSRLDKKAAHLVPDEASSRYDAAIAVLVKYLPAPSRERLGIKLDVTEPFDDIG